jgi:hypothetical protein
MFLSQIASADAGSCAVIEVDSGGKLVAFVFLGNIGTSPAARGVTLTGAQRNRRLRP